MREWNKLWEKKIEPTYVDYDRDENPYLRYMNYLPTG